jgi:hypothetical protein
MSFLYIGSVDETYVDEARTIAVMMRAERLSGRKLATGVQRASLRVDYARTQQAAATLLCRHWKTSQIVLQRWSASQARDR